MNLPDALTRQRNLRRPPRRVSQPRPWTTPVATESFKLVKVLEVVEEVEEGDEDGPHLLVAEVRLIDLAGNVQYVEDPPFKAAPWPGYPLPYYAAKVVRAGVSIVMVAILSNGIWVVAMTGDRVYGDPPIAICQPCVL